MASIINFQELEHQIATQQTEVVDLAAQLDLAQRRLNNLQLILTSAKALESPFEDPDDVVVMKPSGGVAFVVEAKGTRRKTPSTQMVADLVKESGARMTRQEIQDGYRDRYGYPESWRNPINAVNNALARAVENNWLVEEDGLYMAPALARPRSILDIEVEDDDG